LRFDKYIEDIEAVGIQIQIVNNDEVRTGSFYVSDICLIRVEIEFIRTYCFIL
jgi:hypothetical protein